MRWPVETAADPSTGAASGRSRVPPWVKDLIAAALVAVPVFVPFPGDDPPEGVLAIAAVLAPALVLPLRRRWPIPVLLVCLALYGLAALSGTFAPGVVFATSIAMFGVAHRSTRRTTVIAAAFAVLTTVLLSPVSGLGGLLDPRNLQFAATIAFATAAGDASRSRREFIRAMTERAVRAEQSRDAEAKRRVTEERLRIARDLHDAVAHQISVISLNAGVATSAMDTRPEKSKEALGSIRTAARTVLGEIGDLMAVLRADGDESAAGVTPQPGLSRLDELVRRFGEAGLSVHVRLEGDLGRVTGAVDLVAYRVIQEALTNAHKHGAEHRSHVLIEVQDQHVRIVVTNPVLPAPQDPPAVEPLGGHGLTGLRERVASVRGTVETGQMPGGYRVAATLPLAKENRR
ncbi:sensor histidine kinase [Nocardiopsis sp. NRRL B-16309]|uniref:sensor histidine kinase n=1 Tax=Nocardiopsis sp. NRRL B-16309 TaxID=1519494 RepID=UPI0009E8CB4E|nr:histidine kinase [Nocardiopsis sp. NRRL B-16309]